MASEQTDSEGRAEQSHGPRECMPCRGTGKVISNLGGTASPVTCPWCDGGGVRLAGVDAQARWLGSDAAPSAADGDGTESVPAAPDGDAAA